MNTRKPTHDQGAFRLPPGVSYRKERQISGWAYVFRHQELGLLGRIVLQDLEEGRCHVACEVAGDPDDPMTAKCLAIFQPLAMDVVRCLEAQTGRSGAVHWGDPPPRPSEAGEVIESKLMPCERCHAGVALLIFAPLAIDHGRLEDYARNMYAQVAQLNLPTYVIGPAS